MSGNGNVVGFPEKQYWAECLECGSQDWNIEVDRAAETLKAFECAECGYRIPLYITMCVHEVANE